jgi:histidine triad (HIT) family protein
VASAESDACEFCDIVAGRAEASVVHEDDHVVAFIDIERTLHQHT